VNFVLRERFLDGCRCASPEDQAAVIKVLGELRAALHDPQRRAGIGLRKLHPTRLWEVRIGLKLRALFRQEGEDAIFMLLGTHDEVQRFLRNCAD
jgi:hypothetical protein